ncbi:SDR family oxidoreductase [Tardiphaga sp. P9-11]|nr:SDR family oxidoreductase [Tardiphaga sp. P9-11]
MNPIVPGVIDTDVSSFVRSDDGRNEVLSFQTLKRDGRPHDVADVIAFLASDASR